MATKSKALLEHEQDVKTLADWLMEMKDEHDLCDSGFWEGVERLNADLNKPVDISRNGDFEITLTVSFSMNDVPFIDHTDEYGEGGFNIPDADWVAEQIERTIKHPNLHSVMVEYEDVWRRR